MCSPGAPLPFPIPTPILPNKRPPADTTLQPLCLPVGVRLGGGRGLGAGSGAPWEMSLVHPAGLMGSLRGGTVSEPGGADRAAARDGSRRSARRRHGQAGGNGRAERQHQRGGTGGKASVSGPGAWPAGQDRRDGLRVGMASRSTWRTAAARTTGWERQGGTAARPAWWDRGYVQRDGTGGTASEAGPARRPA